MAQPANAPTTGIAGVISISPSHGGPSRAGVSSSAPLAHTDFVVEKGDETVASFTTDEQGQFRVTTPPGHYTIRPRGRGTVMSLRWRFEADVEPGKMTEVQWQADSGMR